MSVSKRRESKQSSVRMQREGLFWMAVAVTSYASFSIFTKLIYARSDLLPLDVASWRFLLATPLVWLYLWLRRRARGALCRCRRGAICSCWALSIVWPRCWLFFGVAPGFRQHLHHPLFYLSNHRRGDRPVFGDELLTVAEVPTRACGERAGWPYW